MKKFRNFLIFLYPIVLPMSLGYHFRLSSSLVFGVPIDYLMPAIFLSDLVGLGLLVSVLHSRPKYSLEIKLLILAILVSALPLAQGISTIQAWYGFARLGGLIATSVVFFQLLKSIQNKAFIMKGIGVSIVLQSFWGIFQVLLNQNLTGYFPFGETALMIYSPAIAKVTLFGHTFLRAYGTTPHPNVLAGILVLFMLILVSTSQYTNKYVVGVGVIGLLFTASRSGILAFGISLIYLLWQRKIKLKVTLIGLICVFMLGVFKLFPVGFESLSLVERLEYSRLSISLFRENFVTGIGLNQFIYHLPFSTNLELEGRNLQPVHNIFLLWIVETGALGLLSLVGFGAFLRHRIKNFPSYKKALLLSILILGSLDHYLLTLPMGMGLLGISLAFMLSSPHE